MQVKIQVSRKGEVRAFTCQDLASHQLIIGKRPCSVHDQVTIFNEINIHRDNMIFSFDVYDSEMAVRSVFDTNQEELPVRLSSFDGAWPFALLSDV